MIKACTLEALQALFASRKAMADKADPEVRTVVFTKNETGYFGHYNIEGSTGNFYNCYVGFNEHTKMFWVGCQCRGGLQEKACYHGQKALSIYAEKVRFLTKDADVNAPYLKPDSEKKPEKLGDIRI